MQVWHLTYLCFTLLIGHDRRRSSVQDIKYASLKDCAFAIFSGECDHLFYCWNWRIEKYMKEWEAEVQHSLVLFSHAWWWGTLQIALREVIITEVSLHFSTVLLDWTDLKENLMKQLSVKWLYSVVDVLSTVFIPLTAFLFPVSPLIYQCNYRAAKKFCWNSLFSPLSTAFSFSNCYFFYIPWLPI